MAQSLGRPLSSNQANVTVNLLPSETVYGDRATDTDIRIAKIFRFGRTRSNVAFDLVNAFNSDAVLGIQRPAQRHLADADVGAAGTSCPDQRAVRLVRSTGCRLETGIRKTRAAISRVCVSGLIDRRPVPLGRLFPGDLFRRIPPARAAQPSLETKQPFVAALVRLMTALPGPTATEGPSIAASIEAMDAGLRRWDATLRSYESAMSAQIDAAAPAVAAQMRVTLGAVLLERGRIDDALRQFAAASRLEPQRPDVHLFSALSYQLGRRDREAAAAFRTAWTLDPWIRRRHTCSCNTRPRQTMAATWLEPATA